MQDKQWETPAWLSTNLWLELRKKKIMPFGRRDSALKKTAGGTVRLCREHIRRTKAQLELNLGNCRPVSLTSVLGKVTEQTTLSDIMRHTKDNQMIKPSQKGLMTGKPCLTNLVSYSKVTCLVDEAVDVVQLDFNEAFDTVSHSILLVKLATHGLDRCIACWVKN